MTVKELVGKLEKLNQDAKVQRMIPTNQVNGRDVNWVGEEVQRVYGIGEEGKEPYIVALL